MHCWKRKDNKITNVNVELKLREEVIKHMMLNVSIKTLGIYLNPMIEWKDQHEYVKNKTQVTIKKLMGTEMKVHQAQMNFNVCVLTMIF